MKCEQQVTNTELDLIIDQLIEAIKDTPKISKYYCCSGQVRGYERIDWTTIGVKFQVILKELVN